MFSLSLNVLDAVEVREVNNNIRRQSSNAQVRLQVIATVEENMVRKVQILFSRLYSKRFMTSLEILHAY